MGEHMGIEHTSKRNCTLTRRAGEVGGLWVVFICLCSFNIVPRLLAADAAHWRDDVARYPDARSPL